MKRLAISAGLTLAVAAALGTVPAAARSGAARSGAVQAGEGGRYAVVLKSDATTDPVSVARSARGVELGSVYRSALSGFSAELTPAAVAALRDNPNAAPHVAGGAAWLTRGTNKPKDRAEVLAVRDKLVNAGNANWTDNSGDGAKEPLLDLHDPTLFLAGGTGGPDATFTGVCDNTGKTCTLDAGLSTGSGLTYRWDFGDGTTDTGVKLIHTYPPTTCTAS